MEAYRIFITPRACRDIEAIYNYIAQDSPVNAAAMVKRILDALEALKQSPHRNLVQRQNRKLRHPVRSLPVQPYIAYFRVYDTGRAVRIIHIRHGARHRPRKFD